MREPILRILRRERQRAHHGVGNPCFLLRSVEVCLFACGMQLAQKSGAALARAARARRLVAFRADEIEHRIANVNFVALIE